MLYEAAFEGSRLGSTQPDVEAASTPVEAWLNRCLTMTIASSLLKGGWLQTVVSHPGFEVATVHIADGTCGG